MQLSMNFYSSEFACHCGCGDEAVDIRLVNLLEAIRARAGGKPITIVSGKRCHKHNQTVGGAKKSQHLLGKAADIRVLGMPPHDVQAMILDMHNAHLAHVGGLGRYRSFTHVDIRDGIARW